MLPQDVVDRFIAAIEAKDIGAATALLHEDVSYENMPMSPIVGRDAVAATVNGFLGAATEVSWPALRQFEVGNLVVNERLDRFLLPGGWLELPVAGFFEVDDDGRIVLWRDYFDMSSYLEQARNLSTPPPTGGPTS